MEDPVYKYKDHSLNNIQKFGLNLNKFMNEMAFYITT